MGTGNEVTGTMGGRGGGGGSGAPVGSEILGGKVESDVLTLYVLPDRTSRLRQPTKERCLRPETKFSSPLRAGVVRAVAVVKAARPDAAPPSGRSRSAPGQGAGLLQPRQPPVVARPPDRNK